jgi:hypothetical protein
MNLVINKHGYEFKLMPHVVVQYDAQQIGDLIHVDSSAVVIQAGNAEEALKACKSLSVNYDDEASLLVDIKTHFLKTQGV